MRGQLTYTSVVPRKLMRLILVVDQSGSMSPWEVQARQALQELLRGINQDVATNYLVTYVPFSEEVRVAVLSRPSTGLVLPYHADGETALWDGLWKALEVETERRWPVLCLVISDGGENVSTVVPDLAAQRHQTAVAFMADEIRRRREWGNWTFAWLSMEESSRQAAEDVGIDQIFDFCRSDITPTLVNLAAKIARFAAELRLTGQRQTKLLR